MARRRLLAIFGALGLGIGLISSGIAAQADTSISDSTFNAIVNYYATVANNGQTFCYAQPASSTACPTLTQATAGPNHFAICVENSTTNGSSQTCDINQTNGSGYNIAIIIQRIRQSGATDQLGDQSGNIQQLTTTGPNLAATVQVFSQQVGTDSGDPTQANSQVSSTSQSSTSGRNFKLLLQSSHQDGQSTSGGTQTSREDGSIDQQSSGISKAFAFQSQHQSLTGGGNQSQSIDPRCCSFQGTSSGDVFQITQKADQHEDSLTPLQKSSTVGQCDSSGNCTIDETASSNAGFNHHTVTCTPGVFCSTAIGCTAAACTPCTPAPEGTCTPPVLAPVVSLSSHGTVALRERSRGSTQSASRYAGVARSAPSAALLT